MTDLAMPADRPSVAAADTARADGRVVVSPSSVHDHGHSPVMVTHDARAAATADRRILFLADGAIVNELGGEADGHVLVAIEEITLA